MKSDLRFALIFSGICFLLLGALLRSAFDAAWLAREEAISARAVAEANAAQLYWLRGAAVHQEMSTKTMLRWDETLAKMILNEQAMQSRR